MFIQLKPTPPYLLLCSCMTYSAHMKKSKLPSYKNFIFLLLLACQATMPLASNKNDTERTPSTTDSASFLAIASLGKLITNALAPNKKTASPPSSNIQTDDALHDVRDPYGFSLLHNAAEDGNLEEVKRLCRQGANMEARDNSGRTPLFWAAVEGKLDFVAYLHKHGAELAIKDSDGSKLLFEVVNKGKQEVAGYLIAQGVATDGVDDEKKTLLHHAAASENLDLLKLVWKSMKDRDVAIAARDEHGNTPLFIAVKGSKPALSCFLMEKRGRLDDVDGRGCTVLHYIAEDGSLAMMKRVCEGKMAHTIALDAKDNYGETAITYAIMGRKYDILEYLHAKGASLETRDERGRTPLFKAVLLDRIEGIKKIVACHVNVNAEDVDGLTAAHLAIQEGSLYALREILASRKFEVKTLAAYLKAHRSALIKKHGRMGTVMGRPEERELILERRYDEMAQIIHQAGMRR